MIGMQRQRPLAPLATCAARPCPAWCEHEHLGSAEDSLGFHHDSEVITVALSLCGADSVYVNVSQHEQAGKPEEPAYVELQNDYATLAVLTSAECVELSRALLRQARRLDPDDPLAQSWLAALAPEDACTDRLPTLALRLEP